MQTIVELRGISKTYRSGRTSHAVLHNISLKVKQGDLIAITGPSGSGKSTLVRILGLLDRPTNGSYALFGDSLPGSDRKLSQLRNRSIGFIFQDYRLIPHYSALENVAVPLKIAGFSAREQKRKARELLKLVGLADSAHLKARELSGGQQQRVGIARALVLQPKLLIADEPTGNLDQSTGANIMKILRTIHTKLGTTIVIVTHSPDIAAQASRIIHLQDGKISEVKR